jgi:hypothetical protein
MGASTDVCKLQVDLVDAIKACENSADCRHRFTVGEAKKIVIEREGELPTFLQKKMVIPQKKTEPSEESNPLKMFSDGIKEIAESACEALNAIIESFQSLRTEIDDTESEKDDA